MKLKYAFCSVAALSLVLAGCSSTAGTPSGSGSPGAAGKTIGLISFSGTDPSANLTLASAKKAAEDAGYKTIVVDANGQVDQANTAMQNLIQRGVAGIAITVFPVDALAAGLQSTIAAGVPVVTAGGGTGQGVAVNVDDSQGETVTRALIKDAKPGGQALTLTYLGGRPCQLRLASFDATVKAEAPELKVTRQAVTVPGQVESATSATLAWLAAHPKGSAPSFSIYACFDDPALGAVAALKQTNRTDVTVYSFNGVAPALAAIKEGSMTGSLWLDQVKVGQTLTQVLDESIKAGGKVTETKVVPAPSVFVTADNYDSFVAEHPDALKVG